MYWAIQVFPEPDGPYRKALPAGSPVGDGAQNIRDVADVFGAVHDVWRDEFGIEHASIRDHGRTCYARKVVTGGV